MRCRLLGLLSTCVLLFGAKANAFACPKIHLRRPLTAATAEDVSTARSSGEVLTSSPSAFSESTASAPPRATKTASSSTRHEYEAVNPSRTSQTSKAAEEGRSSVAGRGHSQSRSLRQDDSQDDEARASRPCSLNEQIVKEHLNETTRTWSISSALVNAPGVSIQGIIDCTKPEDVLSFAVMRVWASPRIVISWPLTLTGPEDSSYAKTTFICANTRDGVFFVKSPGVHFTNLAFEDCALEPGSSGFIVEVENCTASRIRGTIGFHHVSFRNNTLINGTALAIQSPSCSELELSDFVFENNTCDGVCGVIMSRRNQLTDVVIRHNTRYDSENTNTAVFFAPPESKSSVDRMISSENRCSSIAVQNGSLDVTRSTFTKNSIAPNQDGMGVTSLMFTSASVSIIECRFEQNTAPIGGAVAMSESNVTFTNSIFEANTATSGGVMVFGNSSTVRIQSCNFSMNEALELGGVLVAIESRLIVTDSVFEKNSANNSGGCILLEGSSNLTMSFTAMNNNGAAFGGAVALEGKTSGNLMNSSFRMNSASTSGGDVYVEDSTLTVQKCQFSDGSAKFGGGVFSASSNITIQKTVASNMVAHQYGGFCHGENSGIRLKGCVFSDNRADEGGVIHCEPNCRFSDTGSNYSHNSADSGGAVYLESNPWGSIKDCRFKKNEASTSGGAAYVKDSVLSVHKCNFTHGSAVSGGGIYSSSAEISVDNTSHYSNNSADIGGAICLQSNSSGIVTDCQFAKNRASISGGAAYVEDSVLSVHKCSFVNGSAANGGGIYSWSAKISVDGTSHYSNNAADIGGAICLQSNSSGNITDCQFAKNSAFTSGGALYVEDSVLSVHKCNFTHGSASSGGGIYLRSSNISVKDASHYSSNMAIYGGAVFLEDNSSGNISDCDFDKNTVSISGGAVYVRSSMLSVKKCTFTDGSADSGGAISAISSDISIRKTDAFRMSAREQGGGIFLSESVFESSNINISECEAETDGGAIMCSNSSKLLCNGCTLVGNKAASRGGAISFRYSDTRSISLQLADSTLRKNSAKYGGAIQIAAETESILKDCRTEHDKCRVAAMANTSLMDNKARSAGGAIFIDTVAGLRLSCSDDSKEMEMEFYSEEQWKSMKRLTSIDDICPFWKSNAAKRYGPVVATPAFDVRKEIFDEKTGVLRSVNKNDYTIHNHRSGKRIPVIILTAEDELGQGSALGENNEDIEAVMSSPDGFFVGSVKVPLEERITSFSTVGFVQPGTYRILFDFKGASRENFEIAVEVKPCEMGEVSFGNKTFCQTCSVTSYNFSPEEDLECHTCPENGNCSSQVILPNRGYWHQTPCSERVQRCLTEEACDSDNRKEALAELTQNVQTCQFNDRYLQEYTEAQCREGHEGPLCGSCKDSYGKSHSHLCEKCRSDATSVVLVVLSFLVLLGLSSITIRSNLKSVFSSQQQTQSSQSSAASANTQAVSAERRIELAVMEEVREAGSTSSHNQEADSGQSSEDTELAKWKANELLKITVNFLQVTAVAVAIDAQWTFALIALFQTAEFVGAITSEAVNRSMDCLIPSGTSLQRSVTSSLVDASQPLACILVFIVFWLAIKIRRRKSWMYLVRECVLSALVVFYVSYISITKTLINILNCVEVHDSTLVGIDGTTDYWFMDTSIKCYEGSHAALAFLLAWPFLFIFTLGFPLTIAFLTSKKVTEDYKDGSIYAVAGFVYRSYGQKYIFWESVIMSRKALLAVVVVFSYELGANIQAVLASFVLIMALYLQTKCRPYREEFDCLNDVESVSILLSSLTFVSSIFFSDDRVSHGVRVSMSVFLLCANIFFFLYLLALLVRFAAEYLASILVEEGIHSSPVKGTFRILHAYLFDYLFAHVIAAMMRWVNRGRSRRYRHCAV